MTNITQSGSDACRWPVQSKKTIVERLSVFLIVIPIGLGKGAEGNSLYLDF